MTQAIAQPVTARAVQRVLVTGASGFIGRHAVAAMHAAGYTVRAMVRGPMQGARLPATIELRLGDLAEPSTLAGLLDDVDTVVHLGGATSGPWPVHRVVTARGTAALLGAAERAGVAHFVHVSSLAVYDLAQAGEHAPLTEAAPLLRARPDAGAYARGKLLAERLARRPHHRGMPLTIVRPGVVYGPQRTVLPHLGHCLPIGGWRVALGSPAQRLPLVSVHSLCQALLAILDAPATIGRTYNVVDDTQLTRAAYLTALAAAHQSAGRVIHLSAPAAATLADALGSLRRLPGLGRLPRSPGRKIRERARSVRFESCSLQRDTMWRPARDLSAQLARTSPPLPAPPDRPWRVGIIGAGLNSHHHLRALARTDRARVVGVLDLRPGAAEPLARSLGAPAFCETEMFYRRARPEVIHVVTPPATHAAVTLDALGRGMHVLCEKPMAMTVAECDAMTALACGQRVQLGVNHNLLFDARLQRALRLIERGAVGRVVHVHTTAAFAPHKPADHATGPRGWLTRLPGGQIEDLAPHALYTTLALAGADLELDHIARPGRFAGEGELRLNFVGDRVSASVLLSLAVRPDQFVLEVHGTRGSLHIDLLNMLVLHDRPGRGPRALARGQVVARRAVGSLAQMSARATGLALGRTRTYGDMGRIVGAFYASLDEQGAFDVTPRRGRRVVELLRAIWPMTAATPAPAAAAADERHAAQRSSTDSALMQSGPA